ncbi:MAG TPA: GTP-binding protein [Kofleriaceae bacterium]|nr:GTP-binding protein [Kofleriaceae bacterium]
MKVPFTILTGWLGAGKTTALNRMLSAAGGRRIAVLVNELGRIAIDGRLILGQGGDVLELAGGCVCCKVDTKNDLWDGIADVIARSRPEHVVLETTGIAEPAAILETLAGGPLAAIARDKIEPVGVVAVVDGEAGAPTIDAREEAREQLAIADRVLLSKLDVAPAAAVAAVHARLDAIAPHAERAAFPIDHAGALAMTSWMLERRTLRAPRARAKHAHDHGHGHHHGGQLAAIAFADDGAFVIDAVMKALGELGDRLARAKGWVVSADDGRAVFVEKAGARLAATPGGDATRTELVLIGELDEPAIRRALYACKALRGGQP